MAMKALRIAAVVVVAMAGTVAGLYLTNGAPQVRSLSAAEVASANKPFVIKLHAQWCPKCRMTKGVWTEIEAAYADQVHMVVLDFTDDERVRASEAEARRLGLDVVWDEYAGATGIVLVLDRDRGVTAEIGGGNRNVDHYRTAIDAVLGS